MISNVNLSKTILVTLPFCLRLLESEKTTLAKLIRTLPTHLPMFLSWLDFRSVELLFLNTGGGLLAAVGIKM